MAKFVGIIHKEDDSDYGVCFPDFPGCITAGSTLQEAADMAYDALQGHIEVMQEHGDSLPASPISLDDARHHELAEDASVFITVDAVLPGKQVRVNVMMDSSLLNEIKKVSPNRSAFINKATKSYLENRL